jgi:hypothetical protein
MATNESKVTGTKQRTHCFCGEPILWVGTHHECYQGHRQNGMAAPERVEMVAKDVVLDCGHITRQYFRSEPGAQALDIAKRWACWRCGPAEGRVA